MKENSFSPTREALRRTIRREKQQARRSLGEQKSAERSERVVRRIVASPEFLRAETILIYSAVHGEVSLRTLPEAPEAAGKRFAYPRCGDSGSMDAFVPLEKNAWQRGSYGIWEPDPARSVLVTPEEMDLVVCPCVAFDESGARMGMGGGYYDRYLPRCIHADIACVAFEIQKAPELPTEDWDCYMSVVFTDEATYRLSLVEGL